MRLLLLILLYTSTCAAQIIGDGPNKHEEMWVWDIPFTSDTVFLLSYDLLDEFVKDCYKDSTEIFADSGGILHSCAVLGCTQIWAIPPIKVHRGWVHKEPNLADFALWLRRKK